MVSLVICGTSLLRWCVNPITLVRESFLAPICYGNPFPWMVYLAMLCADRFLTGAALTERWCKISLSPPIRVCWSMNPITLVRESILAPICYGKPFPCMVISRCFALTASLRARL